MSTKLSKKVWIDVAGGNGRDRDDRFLSTIHKLRREIDSQGCGW